MNSRERIHAAVNRKDPDRVPVDFAASTVTGISAVAYNRLKKLLGIETPTRVFDVVQQLAMPDPEIIEQFSSDAIDINTLFLEDMKWYPVNLTDGSEAVYPDWFRPVKANDGSYEVMDGKGRVMSRMAATGSNFDQVLFPWEQGYPDKMDDLSPAFNMISWIAHSHSKFVNIDSETLRGRVMNLRANTDKAIVMSGGAKLLELGFFLRRMDNFLLDLFIDELQVNKLLDKLMELHLASLGRKLDAVGDLVDIIRFGDDLGMTNGPLVDIATFRKYLKPRYRQLCEFVRQKSNMKIFFHSCGSIRSLIPDLIEAGFDILNPVQTNCAGMDPVELKQEYGREICFWGGGVDTSKVLPFGTPEEVRSDVLRRCEILSEDGGFVFATIHNIVAEVPPENIVAAFSAVKEFNGK